MTIFFYIPITNEKIRRFLDELESFLPRKDCKIFQNLEAFYHMLISSSDNRRIAVLLFPSKLDFLSVFTIQDLLLDLRLILVVPDREADTIRLAHNLHPRFLSYIDDNFKDVSNVLKQIKELSLKKLPD